MKRIGLLSDTHSYWDERYPHYFSECDEIWHVGDFGSIEIADKLREIKHGENNIILRGEKENITSRKGKYNECQFSCDNCDK